MPKLYEQNYLSAKGKLIPVAEFKPCDSGGRKTAGSARY